MPYQKRNRVTSNVKHAKHSGGYAGYTDYSGYMVDWLYVHFKQVEKSTTFNDRLKLANELKSRVGGKEFPSVWLLVWFINSSPTRQYVYSTLRLCSPQEYISSYSYDYRINPFIANAVKVLYFAISV